MNHCTYCAAPGALHDDPIGHGDTVPVCSACAGVLVGCIESGIQNRAAHIADLMRFGWRAALCLPSRCQERPAKPALVPTGIVESLLDENRDRWARLVVIDEVAAGALVAADD